MHQRHIAGRQCDCHSRGHQRPLERLQRHFFGGAQIGTGISGMGVMQLSRLPGIQRLYQNLDVFRLVVCLVERHQAAHSLHTGCPSSVV